ncbi:MAG: adenosine deaminase [Calditrichaeota bacterium]|nr:adenosine deaminase [Calditrichota bacterium]
MEISKELIKELPKTDLHVHLDGSLRLQTLQDLARQQNVELPASGQEELKKLVMSGKNCRNLKEYLNGFDITLSVMQEPEALERIAFELAEDAAEENIWYMEVRFSPILHIKRGLKLTTIVDAVLEGLQTAEKKFNIKTGIIICGMRNINPETSLRLAELSTAYKNKGVVGFDLAGQEENYPAKDHKEAFSLIRKNNINTTAHAGEAFGPESIHQAIHDCGAHRIGHGTRLYEDGDLLNYVNDHRIPLEICITSNIQTGAAKTYESHPFRFYYDYGLRVTINTDNRLVSGTTITDEYYLVAKHLNLNLDDIKSIIIDGFKSAFLPNRAKSIMLNVVNDRLKKY